LYYNKIRLSSGAALESPSGVIHDPLPLGIYKKQQELLVNWMVDSCRKILYKWDILKGERRWIKHASKE